MKIGVLIPDRNDRPRLMENCLRMLKAQTLQPEIIEIMNDAPISDDIDITYRYRIGYEQLKKKNLDLISFIENDDWYSPDYLETMAREWVRYGRPNIFGTNYTIYYHLKLRSWFTFHHVTRSSAMSTFIMPDMNLKWPADSEPYTDIYLWNFLSNNMKVFTPEKHLCLGIKHGEGKCGGHAHIDRFERYDHQDPELQLLKDTMDPASFDFYSNYFNK